MKKIYLIIAMFVVLFLSGMVYFIVTIDKSFNQKEKVLINTQPKTDTFKDCYYFKIETTDTVNTVS